MNPEGSDRIDLGGGGQAPPAIGILNPVSLTDRVPAIAVGELVTLGHL